MNYGVGLYIKLPVFDVINRKTQVRQAMAEVEQAKSLQQAQRDEIEQIVIKQYEEVLLKQRLLSIKSQNLGSATVNYEMVEKEFRNGTIPTAEYVRLSDMTSRIKSEYEMAKAEFVTAKKILEQIVGFSFKNPVLSEK
jgi:outer membrane protein TolC